MAIASFTTDYADLENLPAYEPAFITCNVNGASAVACRMQVREKGTPGGSYLQISQMVRQPDLSTTGAFTFNMTAIPQDRLSANDNPLAYGYPSGHTTSEAKYYQFVFDELSENASNQIVVTDNDKGWNGATGVVEEGYGTLLIHYASWHDAGNQYYLNNLANALVDNTSYAFDADTTPVHVGAASTGQFLTDLTGVTISEPWSMTLDAVMSSGVEPLSVAYRHTFSAVVYDRTVTGTTFSENFERHRFPIGLKDLEDNSQFGIVTQIFQGFNAGDDDGYQVLLKSGATAMTNPRYKVKFLEVDGCRKVGLEWVNPYGAVDFMEFRMKGNDYFINETRETWERSDYESFSTLYSASYNYPQASYRQNSGRYSLELQSHPLPIDYGHRVLKQMALAPKAWIQIQLGAGGFAKNDEEFTASNITDRIPVLLQFDEESLLVDRTDKGHITINVRANFARRQKGQRT